MSARLALPSASMHHASMNVMCQRRDNDGLTRRETMSLLACMVISAAFLCHAFVYNFLCDDAYISFRYVQNALLGRGLVFNPGEHVEGYTNFLWVAQLYVLGLAGIGPENGSLVLSLLYTIGTLLLTVLLVREMCFRRHWWWAAPVALALLASNRSFAIWTTGGLETRCNTFFIMLGVLGTIRTVRGMNGYAAGIIGWTGACLTRPDSLMLFVLSVLLLLAMRTRPYRIILGSLPTIAVVLLHVLWRRWYYDDWLPNTYYAKVGDPWWDMGVAYLASAAVEYSLWFPLGLAVWGMVRAGKRGTGAATGFIIVLMGAQAVYLARIGGDHFEYRPLDFFWPVLSVTTTAALTRIAYRLAPQWRIPVCTATMAIVILYSCAIPAMSRIAERDIKTRREATLRSIELTRKNGGLPARLPAMQMLMHAWNRLTKETIAHGVGVRYFEHRINAEFLLAHYVPFKGLRRQGLVPADATAKAGAVGIMAFYTDIPIVDLYGLTDRTIARTPRPTGSPRIMAHEREPPAGYIEKRGVNFEGFFLSSVLPGENEFLPGYFIIELRSNLFLFFTTRDPEWARRAFAGKIIVDPILAEEKGLQQPARRIPGSLPGSGGSQGAQGEEHAQPPSP